ncbi:MAG: SAM-dependent methyltransferase [Actinomadura sp.]
MADENRDWARLGIDVTVPSVARMYDYGLGGKDNFAADRELADQILARVPDGRNVAQANRRFLGRAVEFLTGAGIRQFLDLGAGLPSQNNVHEVAQRGCPDARVVYVDNDPVVRNHANAILATDDSTVVVLEDIRNPERILAHPDVRGLLDFSEPIAVMCLAVLHFVTDDEDPWGLVSTLTGALAPGSYLGLSHAARDRRPADVVADMQEKYQSASASLSVRSGADITRFFDGLDLVEPGLVATTDWRSDELERVRPGGHGMLAGVGRKR